MRKIRSKDKQEQADVSPGTWSTDEYIRRWARQRGMSSGICAVRLQSLHHSWIARINFDDVGYPVERIVEIKPQSFQA